MDMPKLARRVLTELVAISIVAVPLLAIPQGVLAAGCGTLPGYEVFQDVNQGGAHAYTCGNGGAAARPDYSQWTTGLFWLANWDNRVSSVYTFNFTGHEAMFYRDANYGGPVLLVIWNNDEVNDLTNPKYPGANDNISSSKTPY